MLQALQYPTHTFKQINTCTRVERYKDTIIVLCTCETVAFVQRGNKCNIKTDIAIIATHTRVCIIHKKRA